MRQVFSYVCGSTNVWVVGGELLPFCQRCTGLYVGCFTAVCVYLAFRPKATSTLLWLHGTLLVGMIPFGYHWVSQNGVVRTVTGFLFACGVVYYLMLLPVGRWRTVHGEKHELMIAWLLAALVSTLVAAFFAGASLAAWIAFIGFLGFLIFGVLLSLSAWCLVRP